MLADDLVERYSRQILLPEVGGRGQERLLAAVVVVAGAGGAVGAAASLLAAAGVGVRVAPGPHDGLTIALPDGGEVRSRMAGTAGAVAALVGHPCGRCIDAEVLALADDHEPPAPPLARAVGALAAAEALRVLLGLATHGRVHRVDLEHGAFAARPLHQTRPCPACGPRP